MTDKLKRVDAEALMALVRGHAGDFERYLARVQAERSEGEFRVARRLVGGLMGAQYFELIEPIGAHYPDLVALLQPDSPDP